MTLEFDPPPTKAPDPAEDLAFLLALVANGDRDALIRLFDLLHRQVERWLSAGIGDEPRRHRLVVKVFLEVWARAEEFAAERISPTRWVSSIVSDVLRAAVVP